MVCPRSRREDDAPPAAFAAAAAAASRVNSAEWSRGRKNRGPPYHSFPTLREGVFKTHSHAQVGEQSGSPGHRKKRVSYKRGGLGGVGAAPPANVAVGCC